MDARINSAVMESLATMGLGHQVPFLWSNWPLDAVHAAHSLTQQAVHLPALQEKETQERIDSGLGLSLLAVEAHGAADWALWPEEGLRTEVLAALELGCASAGVLQKMPFMRDKLLALHRWLTTDIDVQTSESQRVLQAIFVMAIEQFLHPATLLDWSAMPAEELKLYEYLKPQLAECTTPQARLDLVLRLIPANAPEAKQRESSEAAPSGEPGAGEDTQAGEGGTGPQESDRKPPATEGEQSEQTGGEASQDKEVDTISTDETSAEEDSSQATDAGDDAQAADAQPSLETPEQSSETEQEQLQADGSGTSDIDHEPETESLPESDVASAVADAELTIEAQGLVPVIGLAGVVDGLHVVRHTPMELAAVDGKLVSALLRVLQGKKRRDARPAIAGSRIATQRIWRLKRLGDTRIYRRPTQRCGTDIAVELLLDVSGSMTMRIEEAKRVTLTLAQALQRMQGVSTSIDVFPGNLGASQNILPYRGQLTIAHRKMQSVVAHGGTPLSQALLDVVPALLKQRNQRKILWMITDGRPPACHLNFISDYLQRAREEGVETYGIGIGIPITSLIEHSVQVSSVHELPQAIIELFDCILDQATA